MGAVRHVPTVHPGRCVNKNSRSRSNRKTALWLECDILPLRFTITVCEKSNVLDKFSDYVTATCHVYFPLPRAV